MSINSQFFLDTPASRQTLRNVLVQADIGLNESADYRNVSGRTISGASSTSTSVSIHDDLSWRCGRLDNGVMPTRLITFQFRKKNWDEYHMQRVCGVMALLKAFPDADVYWSDMNAELPMLLRRGGKLVLAQREAEPGYLWDPARQPSCLAMIDLPYTIAPLGPWNLIETRTRNRGEDQVAEALTEDRIEEFNRPLTPECLAALGLNPERNPDLLVENRVFDTFMPMMDDAVSVRNSIATRIEEGQTHRVVVDLRQTTQTPASVRAALRNEPIRGLKEVILLTNEGLGQPFRP
jgi:hypothetical protein